jgi:hypothetical protein
LSKEPCRAAISPCFAKEKKQLGRKAVSSVLRVVVEEETPWRYSLLSIWLATSCGDSINLWGNFQFVG